MVEISKERIAELKGKGFLFMKNKEAFVVRIVFPAGIASAQDLKNIAYLAEKYGDGKVSITVRLNAEIVNIEYEKIPAMMEEMDVLHLTYGGTGNRVRPLVCCKGTVCKYGLFDTQKLCRELHDEFYPMPTPHKFKINVTGCPNNCAKVQLNDVGIMGGPRDTVSIFIGGRFGKKSVVGTQVCKIPTKMAREAVALCIDFYNTHGQANTRFCQTLEKMQNTPQYEELLTRLKALEIK